MAKRLRLDALQDLRGVSNELRSIYRTARKGDMPVGEAYTYSRILRTLMECLALVEIETRLRKLEGDDALTPMHPSIVSSTAPIARLMKK